MRHATSSDRAMFSRIYCKNIFLTIQYFSRLLMMAVCVCEAEKVRSETKYRPFIVGFLLPSSERDKGKNPVVDGLAIVSEYTIVAKCVNHGLIYLWDLRDTTKDLSAKDAEKVMDKPVTMLANLKWSDTDIYYMNLGCHKGTGLIVCGDEKGCLWLYNMPGMVNSCPEPIKKLVDPTTKLVWPELQDDHLENSRKVPLDRHDIFIDKVTTSWDCNHIVAVTSNNMVCIWKRTDDKSSSSCSSGQTSLVVGSTSFLIGSGQLLTIPGILYSQRHPFSSPQTISPVPLWQPRFI